MKKSWSGWRQRERRLTEPVKAVNIHNRRPSYGAGEKKGGGKGYIEGGATM